MSRQKYVPSIICPSIICPSIICPSKICPSKKRPGAHKWQQANSYFYLFLCYLISGKYWCTRCDKYYDNVNNFVYHQQLHELPHDQDTNADQDVTMNSFDVASWLPEILVFILKSAITRTWSFYYLLSINHVTKLLCFAEIIKRIFDEYLQFPIIDKLAERYRIMNRVPNLLNDIRLFRFISL